MNQNMNTYRIGIKGLLYVAIQNTWLLSHAHGTTNTQGDFRREVTMLLDVRFRCLPKGP